MPYKSAKQRRFMHAKHPQIAARWDEKYGGKVQKGFLKPMASTHPGPQKVQAPATKMVTKAPKKNALDTRLGLAGPKPFSKRGDWKTIEQREAHQRRDKKIQQAGKKGMGFGLGATALAMRAGPGAVGRQLGNLKTGYQFAHLVPKGQRMKMIGQGIVQNPLGATAVAGGAMIAGGGAVYTGGRTAQAYHQHKINERRKARFKKADTMAPLDHEPTGYARYGNGSGVGRKQTDEFSKGMAREAAKLTRTSASNIVESYKRGKKGEPESLGDIFSTGTAYRSGKLVRNSPEKAILAGTGAGAGGGYLVGRRNRVEKRVRNKDAESDRQRRLGMGIAATGAAGAALGGRGLVNIARTTGKLRKTPMNPNINFANLPKDVQAVLRQEGKPKGFAATYGSAGQVAGGAGLGGTAIGLDRYARSERNRRWE